MREYFQVSAPKTIWELGFVVQNFGVSDFENRINYSLEVKTVRNYDQKRVVLSMPL